MSETPALLVYTVYRLQPGDIDAFRLLALRMVAMGKEHAGCLFLDVAQDIGDPATFRLVEGWRDQAALDAHGASEDFQAVLAQATKLAIVDRSIDVYTIADRKAVALPS